MSTLLWALAPDGDAFEYPVVRDLARALDARVWIHGAVEDAHEVMTAGERLAAVRDRLATELGAPVERSIEVAAHPPDAVAAAAARHDLAVLRTSGRFTVHHGYLGSVADTTVRVSGRPVVMIGPRCDASSGLRPPRVIAPIDGTEVAAGSLPVAAKLAARFEVPLWVVTVPVASRLAAVGTESVEERLVASTAKRLGGRWKVLPRGTPGEVIAEESSADGALVVMATHGRTALRRLAMGSTTMATVRHSTAPVVVVCEGTADPGGSGPDRR